MAYAPGGVLGISRSSETVIGILLCYSQQACCLLYYMCEIVSGIHIYQFFFKQLHFWFRMWQCGFGFEQKNWPIDGFGEKKHGSADLHTLIHPLM